MLHAASRTITGNDTLGAYAVLHTHDLNEAREHVARIFSPHELKTDRRRRDLDTYMANAPLGAVSVSRLRYGATVDIDAGCTGNFVLVMMPLRGSAQVTCGTESIRSTPQLASVVSPTLPLRMTSREDCDQIMVRIDRTQIEHRCAEHLGHSLEHPIEFKLGMDLSESGGASWLALMSYLVSELDRPAELFTSPIARTQATHMVIDTLLLAQPHSYRDALLRPARAIAPAFVRRAEEFIETHADQFIDAADLATRVGVSLSTLFAGFREYRKTSPMALLKQVRLERVRSQLLAATPTTDSVTRIAMQWGFAHLGRFASDYRRKFGESPSETLRR